MAFVLVQHLDPTHESALTSLLSRLTEMPVSEARNNMPLRPDQIYVIPPNKLMGVANRRLKLSPRRDARSHLSVDEFFRTLAEVNYLYPDCNAGPAAAVLLGILFPPQPSNPIPLS